MKNSRITELRKEHKHSQSTLSEMLGVAQATLSQWELGTRGIDLEALKKIAKIYDVTTDYLLGMSDVRKPETSNIPPERARILKRLEKSDDAMFAEVSQFMDYVDFKKGNMDESTAKLLAEKK